MNNNPFWITRILAIIGMGSWLFDFSINAGMDYIPALTGTIALITLLLVRNGT